ncbi:MAG: SlyX family protein [Pseudomonadota bacterium]
MSQTTEEHLAHLERSVEEMSAELARQGREIERLTRRVSLLLERAAEQEADETGGVVLGDETPPHY